MCTYIALALPISEQHESDRAKQADPHHPRVGLDPSLIGFREEADRTKSSRKEDLQGQDRVDFANELHADWECCFRNGAAELWIVSLLQFHRCHA